jgi:4'-phosphopantetheinyl transferase
MKSISESTPLHIPPSPCGISIIAGIARILTAPKERKTLRDTQSRAARVLLGEMFEQHYSHAPMALPPILKEASGKPFLAGDHAPSISLAHSHDWVACATAASGNLGIDLELIRQRDWAAWGEYVFHPEEMLSIMQHTGRARDIQALTLWCLKESLTKAVGTGMDIHLPSIVFSREGRLINLPVVLGTIAEWHCYSTTPNENTVIAISWRSH